MFTQEKAAHIAVATDSDFRYNMMMTGSKVPHDRLCSTCSTAAVLIRYLKVTTEEIPYWMTKKSYMQLTRCGNLAPDFKYPQKAVIFS